MLNHAASVRADENVEHRQADALALPFADGSFDAVVCQFGVMFFPEKAKAYAEARRVLKPGGRFLFNVWDHLGENEFADTATTSLAEMFPEDPPRFLPRTPYGYFDLNTIGADLKQAGFTAELGVATLDARSTASHASVAAKAFCHGTPLRHEIEHRDGSSLKRATEVVTEALAQRFGNGRIDGKIRGHVVSVRASK